MNDVLHWLPLQTEDIDSVNRIGDYIHTTLPEASEVFEEKIHLYPNGCRKLVDGKNYIVGYGIAHSWMLYSIPPLDTLFEKLPQEPDCIYIHDVAIMPKARGCRAAMRYVEYIKQLAIGSGIMSIALVSVYGTDVLWGRFGFQIIERAGLDMKLVSYGASARYMVCDLA